ncbi:ribosome biogenesis GTP-binding protein YihA/YsxC [Hyphococcus flavus]|uniref:Probable GTP-binding protein EngB n=1 Tax=Hyphococcus flavus TaxID=1866326 RepID=A0AAF0CEZ8_9PROT|nr:ribosome biogenesis GTP-binding protein YihA/YsxC [Hyphococcus flavus]WDI30283.1 ribosome biogenesis GTP-binding protein YihA/YsxC [Hyphococcus flavus]
MSGEAVFSSDDLEAGRLLFAKPAVFMKGVVNLDGLPDEGPAEIAFAGRSNVGKSTLLNAIVGQNGLARASNTPGRTREINYFDLEGSLHLVDLPGYGYARASRKEAEQWMALTRDFLRGRSVLRRVCLLVDSRHGLKQSDTDVMDLLDEAAVNYQIVLTKIDKIKPTALASLVEATSKKIIRRPAAHPFIRSTSSEKGDGIPELRAELAALAVL